MVDFYLWEYDYGHNLKPDAAIVVPGMTYQPPLLGYKQLLNFGAYSYPYTGGWIMITVALVALILSFLNLKTLKIKSYETLYFNFIISFYHIHFFFM